MRRSLRRVHLNSRLAVPRAGYYIQCGLVEVSVSHPNALDSEVYDPVRKRRVVPSILRRTSLVTEDYSKGLGMSATERPPLMQKDLQGHLQAIMAESKSSHDGWDKCWKIGVTPWDMESVTPVIQDLVSKGQLPDGRALVPGCGSGYDVLALASENRHVVGLDISPTVNSMSKQMAEADPRGAFVDFIVADFFEYTSEAPFNLIFDYTFFCAIDPSMRSAWAAKISKLLEFNGELITLMFPLGEFSGGPPFSVSVEAYKEALSVHGLAMVSCVDNELAVGPRKGREKLARWRRAV